MKQTRKWTNYLLVIALLASLWGGFPVVAEEVAPSIAPQVSAYYHNLLLKEDGTVWAWGNNAFGESGCPPTDPVTPVAPTQIEELTDIVKVSSGYDHSLARRGDGTVWAWGRNATGQLGNATYTNSVTPVQVKTGSNTFLEDIIDIEVGTHFSVALCSDGTVWTWGYNNYGQLGDGTTTIRNKADAVAGLTDIIAIEASYYWVMAVKDDGTVWT